MSNNNNFDQVCQWILANEIKHFKIIADKKAIFNHDCKEKEDSVTPQDTVAKFTSIFNNLPQGVYEIKGRKRYMHTAQGVQMELIKDVEQAVFVPTSNKVGGFGSKEEFNAELKEVLDGYKTMFETKLELQKQAHALELSKYKNGTVAKEEKNPLAEFSPVLAAFGNMVKDIAKVVDAARNPVKIGKEVKMNAGEESEEMEALNQKVSDQVERLINVGGETFLQVLEKLSQKDEFFIQNALPMLLSQL